MKNQNKNFGGRGMQRFRGGAGRKQLRTTVLHSAFGRVRLVKCRRGLATMDVVMVAGTIFPFCVMLYYLAQACLANLIDLEAIAIGTPLM